MTSKYGNIHTFCNQGHKHDSKKEASFCNDLEFRKKAKDIFDYDVSPKYTLQDKFINSQGEKIRAITYTPDFVIYHDGYNEVVDVKGGKATKTQVWQLKWKWLQYLTRESGRTRFTIV